MTKLQVIETALKSAKAQVKAHLKANNLQDMKLALVMVKSLEQQLLVAKCEGKTAREIVAMGFYVVVDKVTHKIDVFKNLSKTAINNYQEWDCAVLSPVK